MPANTHYCAMQILDTHDSLFIRMLFGQFSCQVTEGAEPIIGKLHHYRELQLGIGKCLLMIIWRMTLSPESTFSLRDRTSMQNELACTDTAKVESLHRSLFHAPSKVAFIVAEDTVAGFVRDQDVYRVSHQIRQARVYRCSGRTGFRPVQADDRGSSWGEAIPRTRRCRSVGPK